MLWVVPPFLAITLSVVLRLSARVKSAAAAQQASGLVTLPLIVLSLRPVERGAAGRQRPVGAGSSAPSPGRRRSSASTRGARAVTRARLLGVDTT